MLKPISYTIYRLCRVSPWMENNKRNLLSYKAKVSTVCLLFRQAWSRGNESIAVEVMTSFPSAVMED